MFHSKMAHWSSFNVTLYNICSMEKDVLHNIINNVTTLVSKEDEVGVLMSPLNV